MTCQGITKAGNPCKFHAEANGYCKHHQDQNMEIDNTTDQDDAYAIAAKRRANARSERKRTGALPGQKLFAEKRPGFNRRFVNEENVDARLAQGYTFVNKSNAATDDIGAAKSLNVGKTEEKRGYLMEIPQEFYDEDQQEKESRIVQTEASIRRASEGDKAIGAEGSVLYNPSKGRNHLLE